MKHTLSPAVEKIILDTNRYRSETEGLAIDSLGTKRPEDAIHAIQNQDGSFNFATSIVEVGLLDRRGATIRAIVEALRGAEPQPKLPQHRGSFSFAHNRQMPALTLTGRFRPDEGLTELDIIRTKVFPKKYLLDSHELHDNPDYHAAACFVHALQKYEFSKVLRNPKRKTMEPSTAVTTFANVLNIGVAQLTREAKLPQLLNTYPAIVTLDDGSTAQTVQTTPERLGHAAFRDYEYTGVSSPLRDIRNWINQVAITHFMETGESIMDYEEASLIAGWFNQKQKDRLQRRKQSELLAA